MSGAERRGHAAQVVVTTACAALAVSFGAARAYGWHEMRMADSRWLVLTLAAIVALLPSVVLALVVAIRRGRTNLGGIRIGQLAIAFLVLAGVVNLMLTGGF